MAYPPAPPPPGPPGGPPPPGYGGPPPGGYGGPPPGGPPPGGYGPGGPGYGGPGGGPSGPSRPSGSSGSSNTPLILLMSALVVVVLLFVVGFLVLRAQGGDDDVELTQDERQAALITAGDVGDGFADAPDDEQDDTDPTGVSNACQEALDALDAEQANPFGRTASPPGAAEVQLQDGDGATVGQTLAPTIDALPLFEDLVDSCDSLTFTDEEGTGTFRLSRGEAPELGDDAILIDLDITYESAGQSTDIEGAFAVWTRSGTDSFVSFVGTVVARDDLSGFDTVPLEDEFVDRVLTTADDKLEQAIEDAG